MTCEQWDLALGLFPFVEVARRKPRPVLVLSSAAYNREHGLVICAMITTASAGRWPSDHAIADLPPTGLRSACVVRLKIMTLPAAIVTRRIGTLAEADRNALGRKMASILPIDASPSR